MLERRLRVMASPHVSSRGVLPRYREGCGKHTHAIEYNNKKKQQTGPRCVEGSVPSVALYINNKIKFNKFVDSEYNGVEIIKD